MLPWALPILGANSDLRRTHYEYIMSCTILGGSPRHLRDICGHRIACPVMFSKQFPANPTHTINSSSCQVDSAFPSQSQDVLKCVQVRTPNLHINAQAVFLIDFHMTLGSNNISNLRLYYELTLEMWLLHVCTQACFVLWVTNRLIWSTGVFASVANTRDNTST